MVIILSGMVWLVSFRCSLVWFGFLRRAVVRCDSFRYSCLLPGSVLCGEVRSVIMRSFMVMCGRARYCAVLCGVRYSGLRWGNNHARNTS